MRRGGNICCTIFETFIGRPMTVLPTHHADGELDRLAAERSAELAELLGYVIASWDDEKRLLARKLHDHLGSAMTGLTMHLALLTRQLPLEPALQDRAAQIKQLLTNIIDANRDMQLALWNDKLEYLGIKAALRELASQFGAEHRIATRVSLPEADLSYPRNQGIALLRCAEEGLRNIAAHARASEVDIILDDNDKEAVLTVRDNGIGPEGAGRAGPGCHGLRLLRERALYLGGTLRVAKADIGGTVLTMSLPKQETAFSEA